MYENQVSKMCTSARAFFLISIISAHIGLSETAPLFVRSIWSHLASIGVIGFLLISSYYFRKIKYKSFKFMIKKKIVSVGIPWLFLGSIGYFSKAIHHNDLSVLGFFNYILGNRTYLYYLTILFLLFCVFYLLPTNTKTYVLLMTVSLVSILLTASGVLEGTISSINITDYLNIFNWCGYFAIGQLLQKMQEKSIIEFIEKNRFILIGLFAIVFIISCVLNIPVNYFSYVGWAYNFLGALCIFSIASFTKCQNQVVRIISKNSFSVYLIHILLIGLIYNLYNSTHFTQAIAPFIICFIGVVLIEIIRVFNDKVLKCRWIPVLFGYR